MTIKAQNYILEISRDPAFSNQETISLTLFHVVTALLCHSRIAIVEHDLLKILQ